MGRRLVLVAVALALLVVCVAAGIMLVVDRGAGPPATAATAPGPRSDGAWHSVYFTAPRFPDRPENRTGGIDQNLVAFIDRAQRTLDVAVYEFDLDSVADALVRARNRNVTVRVVLDTDTLNDRDERTRNALAKVRNAGIPIVGDSRSAIMHHKFVVRDNTAVWTGSYNFTINDTFRNNNNAIEIRSPEVAANFTGEFEKMFTQRLFGPSKPAGVPNPRVTISGATIETYFAPQDRVANRIIERVRQARRSIQFMAFQFTNDDIGQAMLERARNGVRLSGVFETTGSETQFSEFTIMRQAGQQDVYQDGNPYVMHHKVIIIDERVVLFGSYNFSANAERANDENLLIIDDATLAARFVEEFQRVRATALNPPRR